MLRDAYVYVKNIVKIGANAKGGAGVLREIIDSIIDINQKLKSALKLNFKP